MVAAALHPTMDQVGTAAGDDLTAAHVHGDSHHAVGGHSASRGDDGGNLSTTGLRVKIGASTALAVQLGLWVVRVCSTTEERKRDNNIQCLTQSQLLKNIFRLST